jgi:hypothetical protein
VALESIPRFNSIPVGIRSDVGVLRGGQSLLVCANVTAGRSQEQHIELAKKRNDVRLVSDYRSTVIDLALSYRQLPCDDAHACAANW